MHDPRLNKQTWLQIYTKFPISNSNPKGNLGTGRQAAAHSNEVERSTTTPSIALVLIKCQLTLGGAQATMHDWVGMNGWNMCEEYILFTTIHEWRNNQILIGRAWKIFTLTLEIAARLVTLLLTQPNQPCNLDNFLPANSFSSFMQGKVDNSLLISVLCCTNADWIIL